MKAVNLPFYKNRLMEISREIHLEQGWKLPAGLIERGQSNPLNFTRAQWEHAKRLDGDPRLIKAALKECWVVSDSQKAFESALEQRGYTLPRATGVDLLPWIGAEKSILCRNGWMSKPKR